MIKQSKIGTLTLIAVMPLGCSTAPPPATPAETLAGGQSVHCLLPAQVRKLGSTVYPARRQLVFETETRCTLRGGEYTLYDRASAESSAEFYRALAEAGDAEAQYSLGLVYESLYSPPRYEDAARWYQQAATQSHANALKNLSFLYEQGLGVPQDPLRAINLLRQSGGITDDLVMTSEMDAALSAASAEVRRLTQALESQNTETAGLRAALADANAELIGERQTLNAARAELASLETQRAELTALAEQQVQAAEPEAGATQVEVDKLSAKMSERERMLEHQELIIASLSADLSATQAQLEASEQKAALKEKQLTDRLAAVRSESGSDNQALEAALAARDSKIQSLAQALKDVQGSLAASESAQQRLMSELEQSSGASDELTALVATLKERDAAIAEQTARIRRLEEQQAATGASEAELRALKDQVAGLQQTLTEQELGYTALELELQAARQAAAGDAQVAGSELERLLKQVAAGGETISQQKQRMAELEAEAEAAAQALAEVEASRADTVDELDLVQARLVAVEAELVSAQSNLTQLDAALESSRLTQTALVAENDRLTAQLGIAAGTDQARIADLQAQINRSNAALQAQAEEIARLERRIAAGKAQLVTAQQNRVEQLAMRSVPQPIFPKVPDIDLGMGKRYALIVGNDEYVHLNDLTTAVNGAQAIDELLRERYGFETRLLLNATRRQMMVAFSELRQVLEPDDQVFIYYAGHGERSSTDEAITYWLPTDAQENEMSYAADGIKSTWITNELRAMKARHVMIVADSCYAGAMVRPVRVAVPTRSIDERRLRWMTKRRSRTVLTSGGNRPVLDESLDGTHSVFTQALVKVLSDNPGVIYGEALHAALVQLVRYNAEQFDYDQVPRFSEVADANHGNGQFVMKSERG